MWLYKWWTLFFAKYTNFNIDPKSKVLKFEIVQETGAFLKTSWIKCTSLWLPIEVDKFLFIRKCYMVRLSFKEYWTLKTKD